MNVMYYLSAAMKTVGLFSFLIAAPICWIISFVLLHLQKNNKICRMGSWLLNVKYVHKGLGFEIIFDKNGKRVTTPENIGTLNYGPDPKSLGHVFWDIFPYWFWGNSPQDTTPLWRRIYGTDK